MNSSYMLGEDEQWGPRYYFTYYSQFGDRKGSTGIEVVVLAVTFVVAVGANLGIAGCVLRYKEMRTPTNLCLVNLAAADLLFALGVPAVAYTRLTQTWRLEETVCRLLPYSQFVCGFVLLWTLTLISMDRHRCLAVAPYRSALTVARVVTASFITWIIAASLFLPAAFWFQPREVTGGTICTLVFPRSDVVNVSLCFTIPVIIIACLLPMTLVVYHYQRIFQRILDTRNRWAVPCVAQSSDCGANGRRDSELSVVGTLVPWAGRKMSTSSMGTKQGRAGSLSHHEEIRLHKHLRVVRILLLNVVAVLVMWLPITIVMFLIYVDGRRPNEDTNFFLRSHHFVWALVIAQLNTVVNPLLYGVFSENFRACIVKLWRRGLRNGHGEQASGGTGSRKGGRSLEALQDRLGGSRIPGALRTPVRQPKKSSSCSIGSIIEVPSSEKLGNFSLVDGIRTNQGLPCSSAT
ncbi:free fatty acid receptor 4 [Orussus abietinus]|uniref:free fatty acid receptor 4 n=1 Tax=Orussus abietinus TaxID=222816 RepID=UPI000626A5AA|nr:free fatty acid receptor 4 [Orussus abietinus]XP_012283039.1 free fatty acid receptor 4 [Orussus abietinus]